MDIRHLIVGITILVVTLVFVLPQVDLANGIEEVSRNPLDGRRATVHPAALGNILGGSPIQVTQSQGLGTLLAAMPHFDVPSVLASLCLHRC